MNPYLILGLLVAWLASVGGAYLKGHSVAEDAMRAKYATDLENTIRQHNENAIIDMQAAAKVAADEAAARTRQAMIRSQTNEVIRTSPQPVGCSLDSERMRLLNAAVAQANGDTADAAGRLRDATDQANRAIR